MIRIPMSPDYGTNASKPMGTDYPCVVCGRRCRNPHYLIHLWDGTHAVLESELPTLLAPGADMGMYPIGSECLRKNPELKPYAARQVV